VQQTNLITKVTPVYPPEAKAERVQGLVRFEATIGPDGHILNLSVISGPPLLVNSAMEAVKQWVYRPTLLNGNPTTVITTIDVNYTLAK
jgi:protein TonB